MNKIEKFQTIANKITNVFFDMTGINNPLIVKGINGLYYLVDRNTSNILGVLMSIKGYNESDFEIYLNKLLTHLEDIKCKFY